MTRVALTLALLLAACAGDPVCPDASVPFEGRCVDRDGGHGDAGDHDAGDAGDTGHDARDASDVGMDTPDIGACPMTCTLPERCDPDLGECVRCLESANCDADAPSCNAAGECESCAGDDAFCTRFAGTPLCGESGECVACNEAADCTEPGMARCDETTHECTTCMVDTDCEGTGRTACALTGARAGSCVACTEASAPRDCGDFSCNPATNTCTTTEREMTSTCQPCVSDTECIVNHRCITMNYMDVPRGGYCLLELPGSGICPRQTVNVLSERVSLSGATASSYCSVDESAVTCEALLALSAPCTPPCPEGGRCETVVGSGEVCTYTCGSTSECPSSGPYRTCNSATGGYCGSVM